MRTEPLSEHCSLMAHPERTVRPADCPEDAIYIKMTDRGGQSFLNPIAPFPVVIEGGEGDDAVTVLGTPSNPVIIDGGRGNDSVVLQNDWTWLLGRLPPEGIMILAGFLISCATIGALGWRALTSSGARAE